MKFLLFYILSSLYCCSLSAQINIQPLLPPTGIIQKSSLWNIIVINSSNTGYECRLQLLLRDRKTGLEVLSALTSNFYLPQGALQLNSESLFPIDYLNVNPTFNGTWENLIPIGNYIACYKITGTKINSEYCLNFDCEPLSPPMLAFPNDSSILNYKQLQFSWLPPAPLNMFSNLKYNILIAEIQPGQKPTEAISQNIPFYSESSIPYPSLMYNNLYSAFEDDKWYAWQISAYENDNYAGKSEVWAFKAVPNREIDKLIESAPFIKMKKYNPEKGIAHDGILKVSYFNESSDSIIEIQFIDLNSSAKIINKIPTTVKTGENLIKINTGKLFRNQKGKTYKAQIINSRNEKLELLFEIYNYR